MSPSAANEAALRAYIVDLHQQVLDLVRAGQPWDERYRYVNFSDEVKHWIAFGTMNKLNIRGMREVCVMASAVAAPRSSHTQ